MFTFLVTLPDLKLEEKHLPYNLDVWVNEDLQVSEVNVMHLEPVRLILSSPRVKSRVVVSVKTACGDYYREFVFDRSFSDVRHDFRRRNCYN